MTPDQPASPAWYYARQKTKSGPLTWEHLWQLARAGQVQPTDMVLQPGNPRWMPAAQVPGLFPNDSSNTDADPPVLETIEIQYPVAVLAEAEEGDQEPVKPRRSRGKRKLAPEGRRPTAVLVIGVLNFLMAALAIVLGALGVVYYIGLQAQADETGRARNRALAKLLDGMEAQLPGWYFLETGKAVLVTLLGLGLLIRTVGLLQMSYQSRRFCLVYAVLAFFLHFGYLLFEFGLVLPAMRLLFAQAGNEIAPLAGIIGSAGVFMLHAMALFLILVHPRVRRAFYEARYENATGRLSPVDIVAVEADRVATQRGDGAAWGSGEP